MKYILPILLFTFSINIFAQTSKIISGPWAGNVQLRTATIWAEVAKDVKKVSVKYYDITKSTTVNKVLGKPSPLMYNFNVKKYTSQLGKDFNPIKIELNGLNFNTIYYYTLLIDDKEVKTNFVTSFTTKDLWQYRKPAPDFNFLAGSCSYTNEPYFDRPGKPYGGDSTIFETMANTPAAFHLWMGDNWYTREVDYESAWGLNYRGSHARSQPILQNFMAAMPHYAIWDDHDFGPNDSGGDYILKDSALKTFTNYWLNPSFGQNGKGIYTKFSYSDVDFFLTDNRFFRSNDKLLDSIDGKPNPDKHFFGPLQMDWLKNSLLFSNATFKIIVVGSQVINPLNSLETMQKYSYEYNSLINFLVSQKIEGVVFFTGDRHHSSVVKIELPNFYPLYDITISPYTAGISKPKGNEAQSKYRVQSTLVETQNFGNIIVAGTRNQRVMKVEFIGINGKTLGGCSINSSDLKVK